MIVEPFEYEIRLVADSRRDNDINVADWRLRG